MIMLAKSGVDLRERLLFEDMRMILESDCDDWRIEAAEYEMLILLDRETACAMVATPLAWVAETTATQIVALRSHRKRRHAFFAIEGRCIWAKAVCQGDLCAEVLAAHVVQVQELVELWQEQAEENAEEEDESDTYSTPIAIPTPRWR